MRPVRFAHLADLHLDTPFKGLSTLQPDLAQALQDASLNAWDHAVTTCLDEAVDFVVIAGDVYDSSEAGVRAQLRFLAGLRRLSAEGIPVFIVHGNHDPRGGRWSAIPEWPQGVTVFGHREVEVVPVERDGETLALVHGMSFGEQHVTENLALRYKREPQEVVQVGVLHCSVGDHPEHGRYAPCSLDDLTRSGLDYWALGHIHTRQVVKPASPAVVYPGNVQARHPGEEGEKGFYLVELTPAAAEPSLEFRAVDAWRFATLRVDLAAERVGSIPDLQAFLENQADALQDKHTERGLIVRAEIVGASELHAELSRADTVAGLLGALRDSYQAAGLWWDELRLRTRPQLDREARLQVGDFISDLLAQSDEEASDARAFVSGCVDELRHHSALRKVASQLDVDALTAEAEALWQEAEALAFDRMDDAMSEGE